MKKNSWILGGLLAATLALGCQVTSPMGAGQPRVVVHYGSMQLAPDADLAITLDLRSLLGTGYRVQQAGNPTVAKIVAKISGPHLAEPVTTFVNTIDCTSGQATLNFTNLPPGPVDVVVNALDAAGNPIAWASNSKPVVIHPGVTAVVDLVCSTQGGGLTINFSCGNCGGSPSPSPTASGSPAPTPTPVPTPVPSPRDPSSLAEAVTGLTAGSDGTIYIFAKDPVGTNSPTANAGRMLAISSGLQTMDVVLDNHNLSLTSEGDIFRINNTDVMFASCWMVGRVAFDLTNRTNLYVKKGMAGGGNYLGGYTIIGTPTDVQSADFIANGAGGDIYKSQYHTTVALSESTLMTDTGANGSPFYYFDNLSYDQNGQIVTKGTAGSRVPTPSTMAYDAINNRIIWASDAGILSLPFDYSRYLSGQAQERKYITVANDPAEFPTLLVNVPEEAESLTLGADDGSLIYFTKKGSAGHDIYVWDGQSVRSAWHSNYGSPFRIEKGLDGKYYALIFEGDITRLTGSSNKYRVIRFDQAVDGTLVPDLLMVDTIPTKPASL